MEKLSSIVNIGKELQKQLYEVEINTIDELKKIGSKEAWLKIKKTDPTACINRLYALEGAIEGIRWHDLDDTKKKELKEFYLNNK